MSDYIISEMDRNYILYHPEDIRYICGVMERSNPITEVLKIESEHALNELMKAIDWRFNDTEKGRMIIKTIQEIKDNLSQNDYPPVEGLQEFPFRNNSRGKQ